MLNYLATLRHLKLGQQDRMRQSIVAVWIATFPPLQQQPAVTIVDLAELPSLAETEEICLKQKPHKAPGPDGLSSNLCRYGAVALSPHLHGLMLKAFLTAVEPCRHKGGYLVPVWKQKGPQNSAESYRGILLSDTYSKIYHAWLRKRLLPTMLQRRALGQLGGLSVPTDGLRHSDTAITRTLGPSQTHLHRSGFCGLAFCVSSPLEGVCLQ